MIPLKMLMVGLAWRLGLIEVLLPAFVLGCLARPRGAAPGAEAVQHALHAAAPPAAVDDPGVHGGKPRAGYPDTITAAQPSLGWGLIALHVLALTLLGNLGKMVPAFCYRREAHWRHRLAVAIGMWPRGEVGAGVLVLSLSYGIGGPIVTVAMLSLALNLALTGVFILGVKRLIAGVPEAPTAT